MILYQPPKDAEVIPLIDIAGLYSEDLAARKAVATEIHKAARYTGFFYIAGHRVPQALMEQQLEWTRRVFALPDADKQAARLALSPCRRGWEGLATQVLDEGTPPDYKESYYVGRDLGPDHPYVRARLANHGPNQWPAALPELATATMAYFDAVSAVDHLLMRGLALSLELPEDYFEAMMQEPMPILRMIHYPPQPERAQENQLGAGAHTDWGAMTLLLQDQVGGLEVQGSDGQWVRATPIPGTFVVNLGDLIARWTNGLYHSNMHRVRNGGGHDRYSIAYFGNPDPNARVECLPTCMSADNPPRFAPCTAGQHIEEMYRLTMGEKKAA